MISFLMRAVLLIGILTPGAALAGLMQTYDSDASVYFAQLSINGCATPTPQFKAAINGYIISEKMALNWGNQDAQYLLATTDSCTAGTNLAQPPLYRVTWSGSPSFTVQSGLSGDGSTVAGDTGVQQSALTRMTQNNSHVEAWPRAANVINEIGLSGTFAGMRIAGITNRVSVCTSAVGGAIIDNGAGTGGLYFCDRTSSLAINTGSNGFIQNLGATSASSAMLANEVTICKASTTVCPLGTNLLFVGFGAAMYDETAHYTNVRNLLMTLGVTGI